MANIVQYSNTIFLFIIISLFPFTASGEASQIDSLKNLSPEGLESRDKVKLNFELSKQYGSMPFDSSFYLSHAAMELSKEIDYPVGIGMSLFSMGELALQYDSLTIARKYLIQSLSYFDDCNCDSIKAEVYFSIGRIYLLHDNYLEAQEFFIRSLHLAENRGFQNILFKLYFWMARMYDAMENIEDAEHYYIKSLELSDTLVNDPNTVFSFYNLGKFYLNTGELLSAEKYIQKAIDVSDKLNATADYPLLYCELGNIKYTSKEYGKAMMYYNKAEASIQLIDPEKKLQIHYWTAFTIYYKGRCYYQKADYKSAIRFLKQAKEIAAQEGYTKLESNASEYLAKVYENLGKYNIALTYFKDFHNLQDSIISVYNVSKVTKLEMEYRYMKELHKKRINQLQAEKRYLKKIQNYRLIIASAFLLLVILLLLFIIYRNAQRTKTIQESQLKEKLESNNTFLQRELEFKNREMTTSLMYLMKKNNFLRSLNEKLKQAILPLKSEEKKPIEIIIKDTTSNIESDAWEEFEARFNQVHQNFSERLLKDFSDLTPNELKLCAFLKLNMTTKEILSITHQSANSISVARHRLRTKLGIDRDENLITFLMKY